jgi:hypothetical protein
MMLSVNVEQASKVEHNCGTVLQLRVCVRLQRVRLSITNQVTLSFA